MNTLDALISNLRAIDRNRNSEHVAEFEQILAKIISLDDVDSIVQLLEFFEDDSPFGELMFSIIHGIEIFDDDVYVEQILKGSGALWKRSPDWAVIIFIRIINAEGARLELVRQLRSSSQARKLVVRSIMEKINDEGPQFIAKTTSVIMSAYG